MNRYKAEYKLSSDQNDDLPSYKSVIVDFYAKDSSIAVKIAKNKINDFSKNPEVTLESLVQIIDIN